MIRDRRGSTVVVVLLLLLAATGLAHGTLLMARGELAAAKVRQRSLERRAGAELALARALRSEVGAGLALVPPWGELRWLDTLSTTGAGAWFRKITREVSWVRGTIVPEQGPSSKSAGRLVWMMDPFERLLSVEGAVAVSEGAPLSVQGVLDPSRYHAADPPLVPAMCAAVAPASFVVPFVPAVALLMPGEMRPGIGPLPFDSVLARTPRRIGGTGTPAPRESGGLCIADDPWSWGDPDRPWRPCGTHVAVRAAEEPVIVDGGVGQGALVVDGDLTLTGGARLHGFALVTGALRLMGGAELHGVAVAAGGLDVSPDSRVVGSACWAHRALEAAASVWSARPLLMPGVGAVGP